MTDFPWPRNEFYGPLARELDSRADPPLSPRGVDDANPPSWAPSTAQIALVSPAYTRSTIDGDAEHSGSEQEDFSDTSSPNLYEVTNLIVLAVSEVAGRVGIGIDVLANYPDLAQSAVIWHVASTIEANRNPDGAAETNGAYQWKRASYVACINELIAQARRQATRLW